MGCCQMCMGGGSSGSGGASDGKEKEGKEAKSTKSAKKGGGGGGFAVPAGKDVLTGRSGSKIDRKPPPQQEQVSGKKTKKDPHAKPAPVMMPPPFEGKSKTNKSKKANPAEQKHN